MRSSVVASQIDLHAAFGGVVPELASRAHVETITPVVAQALTEAGVTGTELAGVAVTSGPGLVGALLVGIASAKALALGWGVPVVGVNHLEGHLASVYLADPARPLPPNRSACLGRPLHARRAPRRPGATSFWARRWTTRSARPTTRWPVSWDSAIPAGRCSTVWPPGGEDVLGFPRPMLDEGYTFSFSGLKTAVVNHVRGDPAFSEMEVAASFVAACMDVLDAKLRLALRGVRRSRSRHRGRRGSQPDPAARAQALADEFGTRLLIPPRSWPPTTPP